jgi:deoxycytidylate deaminase
MEQTIKPHKDIMAEADSMTATAGVRQKGNKMYLEVKHRITILRRHYAIALGIDTTLLEANDKYVRVQAKIADPDGRVIASGMAEEIRGKGLVNQTSALENAETSAVGRALASLGLHGGEYASANEMDAVVRKTEIQNQETPKPMPDDPIPEPFPQTQTSNGSAAEFHPSANWDAWIAIAKADIEKFSSSGDTMSWFEKNKEYLKDLEKENITKHAELAELWSDKHERMNP